jgi:hypothetical protein
VPSLAPQLAVVEDRRLGSAATTAAGVANTGTAMTATINEIITGVTKVLS